MSQGKLYISSINLSELIDQAKNLNPAFSRAKNGKVYASVSVWVNEEKDRFGNHLSISLIKPKDAPPDYKNIYVGQGREYDSRIKQSDIPHDDTFLDDIPYSPSKPYNMPNPVGNGDDMPF